jgi:hypothetical protein
MKKLTKRAIASCANGKLSQGPVTEIQKLPNEPRSEQPTVESVAYLTTLIADSEALVCYPRNRRFRHLYPTPRFTNYQTNLDSRNHQWNQGLTP